RSRRTLRGRGNGSHLGRRWSALHRSHPPVRTLAEVFSMVLAPQDTTPLAIRDVRERVSFARIREVQSMPNLIDIQRRSFRWFLQEGLGELFAEISPIQDFTGKNMDLELAVPGPNGEPGYSFGEPKYSEEECRETDSTYAAPLRVRMRLTIKGEIGEIKEMDIFMGDFPMMTTNGTFIINGAERVVVSQLVRSPGAYFTLNEDPTSGRLLCMGKLIPSRGAWLEFETSNKDVLSVKVDRKRKIPLTTLLRAVAAVAPLPELSKGSDEELVDLYETIQQDSDHDYIGSTIARESEEVRTRGKDGAVIDFYRRLRPGDPPTVENAKSLLS